jgi:hypothetical protein
LFQEHPPVTAINTEYASTGGLMIITDGGSDLATKVHYKFIISTIYKNILHYVIHPKI